MKRGLQIVLAFAGFLWAWLRLRHHQPQALPDRLRRLLEDLGTTFVKLGQGLSLRRDVLPPGYRDALAELHNHVPPFQSALAIASIERELGQPVSAIFARFESDPFAAASVAQVHRARLHDGRDVIVKIRRPGIVDQIKSDLRLLRLMARMLQAIWPALRRQRPLELIDELGAQLMAEINLEHEARNMRRLLPTIETTPGAKMPRLIEPFATPSVLVQERSEGTPLAAAFGTEQGRRMAGLLLDAYVQQLFVAGVFHGDPHPGNLFALQDGRLCFHDFGTVGYLDPTSRVALSRLVDAISHGDADDALDSAISLGFLPPAVNRRDYVRAISEILDELRSLPISQWSLAETMWRIARVGHGDQFRLPPHLLVLLRTLFLAENTIRALDPDFDLLVALKSRRDAIAIAMSKADDEVKRPATQRIARAARALPAIAADLLRQAQAEGGLPGISINHRGLEELELHLARTGNRLSMALVTLGLYVAGSLLMLHSAGPRVWGDVPLLALVAYAIALALTLRLVVAIARSGHL